jgi:enediyne biosynthesis protein E5
MSATAPAITTAAPIAAAPTKKKPNPRMGLRTSATFATIFTILGHTVFGFEQSWAQVVVALLSGHSCALLFEWVDAKFNNRAPEFAGGGWKKLIDFMLAPHMTSITMSFLIFVNDRLWIMALACALAIGSKYVLRVRHNGRLRHFMNPSNFAIAVVLLTYQWTGMLPWMYTADLHGAWDWVVPSVIVMLGVRLNIMFTGRIPTILSWLGGFFLFAAIRCWIFGYPYTGQLVVLTGIPMVLFTLYMITDPQTSPTPLRSQILFGSGIALAYSVLLAMHVQYTMFYSVTIICTIRGLFLFALNLRQESAKRAGDLAAVGAG